MAKFYSARSKTIPPLLWQTFALPFSMPKGTDLSDASQTWLNDVARLMNERPRKTLGWKTPAEAMAEEIRAFSSTVALDL